MRHTLGAHIRSIAPKIHFKMLLPCSNGPVSGSLSGLLFFSRACYPELMRLVLRACASLRAQRPTAGIMHIRQKVRRGP